MDNTNFDRRFATLDPSTYSKREFIEFIADYLRMSGLLETTYVFSAGNNMEVSVVQLDDKTKKITYSYNSGELPIATVTQFVSEYGISYGIGDLSIDVAIQRKSYPLKSILWNDVAPAISENKMSLASINVGQSYIKSVSNNKLLDGNAGVAASGGTYLDIYDRGGTLTSHIVRQTRHFWGRIQNLSDTINVQSVSFSSNLGVIPGQITISHGDVESHFVIVTTDNIEVFANGLKVGVTKLTNQLISPYAGNLNYTKAYNIYISTGKSTGNYTYTVKST